MADDTSNLSTAIIVSPMFPKSNESYGKCLKFKYKLVGPGAKSLMIYQELDYGYARQPIWIEDAVDLPSDIWHYGQTSVTSISSFRVGAT